MRKLTVNKYYKRMLSFLLVIGLLLTAGMSVLVTADEASAVTADTPVAENDALALYVDAKDGNVIVEDKKTGERYGSCARGLEAHEELKGSRRFEAQSVLVLEYVEDYSEVAVLAIDTLNSYEECVMYQCWDIVPIPNGVRLEYNFEDYGFFIPVEITLDGGYCKAAVRTDQIKETGNDVLVSISLLPYMASGDTGEKGSLFIPQGSGAMLDLNKQGRTVSAYDMPVYGTDLAVESETADETVSVPVFGVCHENNALLGIITSGAEQARIQASGAVAINTYSHVNAAFRLRATDELLLFEGNEANERAVYRLSAPDKTLERFEVAYRLLASESPDYVTLANGYREYLLENGALVRRDTTPMLNMDVYGCITKQASFLGIPYQKKVALTTFDEASALLNDLHAQGVSAVSMRYNGWTNNGLTNKKLSVKTNPLSVLGGSKGFRRLLDAFGNQQDQLILAVDLMHYNKSGHGFSTLNDSIRNLFNVREPQYKTVLSTLEPDEKGAFSYLLRADEMVNAAKKQLNNMKDMDGVGISVTGMGDTLYSDFATDDAFSRTQAASCYGEIMSLYTAKDHPISVDKGNAYTFAEASRIWELPNGTANYFSLDESVPFLAVVLHGYVPYTAPAGNRQTDATSYMLYCLETGSEPMYRVIGGKIAAIADSDYTWLYSTEYATVKDAALRAYRAYTQVYASLHDKAIVSHRCFAEGVYGTTFADGTTVLVNYSESAVAVAGVTVAARDFAVTKEAIA